MSNWDDAKKPDPKPKPESPVCPICQSPEPTWEPETHFCNSCGRIVRNWPGSKL